MFRIRLLSVASLLLVLAGVARAAPPATDPAAASSGGYDTWMSVVLDGRKIGHLHQTEVHRRDRVESTTRLAVDLNRLKQVVHITSTTRSSEDLDGQPLAFSARLDMSNMATTVQGTRQPDGTFRVISRVGGLDNDHVIDWPAGAHMLAGQRRVMRQHGLAPGTRYTTRNFDPASQRAVRVDTEVMGLERVLLPDGPHMLHHLRQKLHLGDNTQVMDLWVDNDYRVLKGRSALLGFSLEMLACSRRCANAPNQDIDLLSSTMVDAPRPLAADLRRRPMRYLIKVPPDQHIRLINTSEQRAFEVSPGLWRVDVVMNRSRKLPGPVAADTQSTDWLQAASPVIVELSQRAIGDARTSTARMVRMSSFVHDYIDNQGLSVGYASALEAAHTRAGDCTEHAVLLAAMARAQGIPARVVTGLAFADRYAGHFNVFVPHAWVQAWLGDHWQSFDPTLGQFDSAHIALAVGDGDPWEYFADLRMLGHMRIVRATLISDLMNTGSGPAAIGAPSTGGASDH